MNVAYYLLAFDHGVDELWQRFGITDDHIREMKSSTFAVEAHVTYQRELNLDDPFVVTTQILAYDEKRIHQFQRLYHAEQYFLAATVEWMHLHVDLVTRRVAPWPAEIRRDIAAAAASQGDWPHPHEAGRQMRISRPLFGLAASGEASE
jgi:acyl-CoA thioester hydrolase